MKAYTKEWYAERVAILEDCGEATRPIAEIILKHKAQIGFEYQCPGAEALLLNDIGQQIMALFEPSI